ncbi:MAG: NAD(P)/FAD-dependent oxidoreductase [Pseudomonadota bacterium]
MKIAVAGAGIGGLTVASLLHDRGHDVTIFDQMSEPQPVGSGLVIQPVGQTVLHEVGAGDYCDAKGASLERMQGREVRTGRRVLDVRYGRPQGRPGKRSFGLSIHRATLFHALMEQVTARGIHIVPAFQVSSARAGTLRDAAGRDVRGFELIVDALGANSPLSPLVSVPLPYGAVWGTVDWPEGTELPYTWLSQRYRRAANMIGAMPCGSLPGEETRKAAIFWSLPTTAEGAFRARGLAAWRTEACALWPAFAPFLDQITDLDQMTMARYGHGTLAAPYGDGIAYIGDSAHRASPQLGQGANMALLDALALARALEQRAGQAALRLYAQARRRHVAIYQAMSWAFTPQYQSNSRLLPWLRDAVFFPISQVPPVPRILNRLVCGDLTAPLGRLT